ncbi:MAG: restriction endonuclease subunit S [Caldicoprobacterales bacterium]
MLNSLKKVRLDELGEIITGNTPSKKNKQFYNSKDIPFIKPDDLNEFGIKLLSSSKEYISNVAKSKARMLEKGSILFTCIGIIGKVGIIDCDKAAFNQQINAIIPNNNKINSRYLAYCLYYNRNRIKHIANAPVVPIINKTQFKQIEILIHPNIQVQYKVADILDKAQRLIDKRKKQIKECDRLIESLFYYMFGDPVMNSKEWRKAILSEICDVRDGTHDSPKYIGEGYPLVTSKNIVNGKIDLTNVNFISYEDYMEINKRSKVDIGDIIMPMIGTIGNPAIVESFCEFAIKNLALIKCNDKCVNNIFLKILLKSKFLEIEIIKKSRGGTQKFLSLGDIRNLKIPLPPLDLQKEFADKVQKIEQQKQLLEKSLALMEDNFNSLMQKAFRGELF